jgi:hypothetical protein
LHITPQCCCDIKQRVVQRPDGRGSLPVITGLDPVIHPLRKKFHEDRWVRGSSPHMTEFFAIGRICSNYDQ